MSLVPLEVVTGGAPHLSYLGALPLLGYVALFAWKARAAFAYAREENRSIGDVAADHKPYELTVLQPILSGDPTLESCLEANLSAHGEGTAFLWLVDDDDAEAQRIAEKLRRPGV